MQWTPEAQKRSLEVDGMKRIEPQFLKVKAYIESGCEDSQSVPYSDDFIMALLYGPDEALQKCKSMIDNSALVCALLLSLCVGSLMDMPASIAAKGEEDPARIIFVLAFSFTTIISCVCREGLRSDVN